MTAALYYTVKVREYSYKSYGHLGAETYDNLMPEHDRTLKLIYVYNGPSLLQTYVSFDQCAPHGKHEMLSNGDMDVTFHYTGCDEKAHLHRFQRITPSRQRFAHQRSEEETRAFFMMQGRLCIVLLEVDITPRAPSQKEWECWLPFMRRKIPNIAYNFVNFKNEQDEEPVWGSRRSSRYKPY